MSKAKPSIFRRLIDVPAEIIVAIYVIADAIIAPLFRPLIRALSRLSLIKRVESWIGSLNPYVILVLLAVPFIIAEFTKVFGVFLMSEGHFRTGMTLFIGAYVVSILVCERIFHAGKTQLLTIGWFAKPYYWVMALKDRMLAWFRETRIWKLATLLRQKGRIALRRTRVRTRAVFGRTQRGIYERQ